MGAAGAGQSQEFQGMWGVGAEAETQRTGTFSDLCLCAHQRVRSLPSCPWLSLW